MNAETQTLTDDDFNEITRSCTKERIRRKRKRQNSGAALALCNAFTESFCIAEISEDIQVFEGVPKPETGHHRRRRMLKRVKCDDERRAEALRALAASYAYECKEVAAKTARRVRVGIYYLRFMCERCNHILSEVCATFSILARCLLAVWIKTRRLRQSLLCAVQ